MRRILAIFYYGRKPFFTPVSGYAMALEEFTPEELKQMSQDAKRIVADNIRALMMEKGWTQKDLERKSGVAQKTISNILRTGSTTTGKLAAVAGAFGLKPWVLLFPGMTSAKEGQQLVKLVETYASLPCEGRSQVVRIAEAEAKYLKR